MSDLGSTALANVKESVYRSTVNSMYGHRRSANALRHNEVDVYELAASEPLRHALPGLKTSYSHRLV